MLVFCAVFVFFFLVLRQQTVYNEDTSQKKRAARPETMTEENHEDKLGFDRILQGL